MTNQKPKVVRIVDDDRDICDSLSCLLELEGFEVRTYTDPKLFLRTDLFTDPGCVILDFRFPDMNGLEVQQALADQRIKISTIFLTAHGDLPLAVKAMQRGASDFLLKPVEPEELLKAVTQAVRTDTLLRHGFSSQDELKWCLSDMREREKDVLRLLRSSKDISNKMIAERLCLSERTVENYRASIYRKLSVHSVDELFEIIDAVEHDASVGLSNLK